MCHYLATDGFKQHRKWNKGMLPNVAKGGKDLKSSMGSNKIRPNDGFKMKIKTY